MDKDQKENADTPIIDGDARPDISSDPEAEKIKRSVKKSPTDEKFSTVRESDRNTLEDYKDAK